MAERGQWQPDRESLVLAFQRFVEDNCQDGTLSSEAEVSGANCRFAPYPALRDYFDDRDRLRKLLRAICPSTRESLVDPRAVQENYVRVFSILLCIGEERHIESFVQRENLNDDRLPFDERPQFFPSAAVADSDFFPAFHKKQWMFCPPDFCHYKRPTWQPNRILPIVCKEKISDGGSAVTYKIVLHPAYNNLYSDKNRPVRLYSPSDCIVIHHN